MNTSEKEGQTETPTTPSIPDWLLDGPDIDPYEAQRQKAREEGQKNKEKLASLDQTSPRRIEIAKPIKSTVKHR